MAASSCNCAFIEQPPPTPSLVTGTIFGYPIQDPFSSSNLRSGNSESVLWTMYCNGKKVSGSHRKVTWMLL
ncbi:hypothetical protein GQ457_06G043670 [Hibiscus cannabinus]